MKKIVKRIIIIVLCITLNNSALVSASEISSVNESNDMNAFIEKADNYLEVNDEGLIELDLPDNVVEMIGSDEYEKILQGIDEINSEVKSGEVIVTDNGTIYDISDEELVVQGGNVNKVVRHWWGFTRYANNKASKKLAKKLYSNGSFCALLSTGAGGVAFFPGASLPAGMLSVASGISSAWQSHLADRITEENKGKGVKITLTWCLIYTVKGQ